MVLNRELRGKVFKGLAVGFFVLFFSGVCQAGLPLITDDTGTQGRENFQVEFSHEFAYDKTDGVEVNAHQLNATLTFGVFKAGDLVLSIPYVWATEKADGVKTSVDGFADASIEFK